MSVACLVAGLQIQRMHRLLGKFSRRWLMGPRAFSISYTGVQPSTRYGVGGTSRGGGIIYPQSAHHLEYNDTNLYKFYKPTPHYEQVRRLNSILRIFGKVSRIPSSPHDHRLFTGCALVLSSCDTVSL